MASIKRYAGKTGISWQVRIRKGGKLKSGSFSTKKQAEEFIALEEADIIQERYFPQLHKPASHTVGELIDLYTQRILTQRAPKTQSTHGACLTWWKANLGDTNLTHVTPALLEDYVQVLRNKAFSPAYINQFIVSDHRGTPL